MANMTKEEMLKIVSDNIEKLQSCEFNAYFYIFDTKGVPNGILEYIYQCALTLKNLGYKVSMLHNEVDEFVGVADWMGDAYAALPHLNVNNDAVEMSASDFLFIPEILSSVMAQTKKLPCKRVIILQNFDFFTEFVPVGITPGDLKITDCIANTKENMINFSSFFPDVNVSVVRPCIKKVFRKNDDARNLIINLVTKDKSDTNKIVKPFYWRYPVYKWVSFRDLRNVSEDVFAEALREAPITICVDDTSNFGYNIAESLICGSITLAKVPDNPNEWMADDDGNLYESVIWFDDIKKLPDMIASLVRSWTEDTIPEDVIESVAKGGQELSETFSNENHEEDVKKVFVDYLFERRLREFKEVKKQIEINAILK